MKRRIIPLLVALICATITLNTPQTTNATQNTANIAADAVVTASSAHSDPAYSPLYVVDGIYGVPWANEWVAAYDDNVQWIKLSWSAERAITNICLFDSAETDAQSTSVKLELNDGYTQSGIVLPNDGLTGNCITLTGPHNHVTSLTATIQGHIGLPRLNEIAVIGALAASATPTSTAVPAASATPTSTAVPAASATPTSTAVPGVTATPTFFRRNTYIPVAQFKTYHCVTFCHFRAVNVSRFIRSAVNGAKRVSMYLRANAYRRIHLHRVYGGVFVL